MSSGRAGESGDALRAY